MRILALNGSYRGARGSTRLLLDRLQRGVLAAGASFELVDLSRYKLNRCLACDHCQAGAANRPCVYAAQDDAADLLSRMAAADGLIFASPVYMLGMSVLLKTLLDRTYSTMPVADFCVTPPGLWYHTVDPAISRKPFVALITCANFEPATPHTLVTYFKTYARFNDAPQVGLLVRNATDLLGHPDLPDEERPARVQAVLRAYEQAGRELARSGRLRRRTQRAANAEIVPIPGFALLKRIGPLKRLNLARARQANTADVGCTQG